ncbi:MAG: HmuY family protein [Myxococcota bacterium]
MNKPSLTILLASFAVACAPSLGEGADAGADDAGEVNPENGPNVEHLEQEEGGAWLTRVDATSDEDWVYLDLATGTQLEVDDPMEDLDWDIAFLRFHVKINGGISGMADAEAARLDGADFDTLEQAPVDGYRTDEIDGDDDDEHPDYAIRDWYDYNIMTHILTPANAVYVLRIGDTGDHYRIGFQNYYDDAGTSGYQTFLWSPIAGD